MRSVGSSPFLRPWARRWMKKHWSLWRKASATPDLRLPSQPQGITVPWPVPNNTAWWQRHMCVNNLPKVVTWKQNGRDSNPRPFELQVHSSNHCATGPHWLSDTSAYLPLTRHRRSKQEIDDILKISGRYAARQSTPTATQTLVIPAKAFARDYVITGVGSSVCLFVCYHDN